MYKFGLKLWSINDNYIPEAVRLYNKKYFDYIELYIVPKTFDKYASLWKEMNIPIEIHAPHSEHGMNLALNDYYDHNVELFAETKKFADYLGSNYIVTHLGISGTIEEATRQINKINDNRIVIENKPYDTMYKDGSIGRGHSVEEIQYVLEATGRHFCLDIEHCFCASNALGIDNFKYLSRFLQLNPLFFHLTDGKKGTTVDTHTNLGKGELDLKKILSYLPENSSITLETKKPSKDDLNEFANEIVYLRSL